MDKKLLYDWVFHFNHYTNLWSATKRDNQAALFSDNDNKDVLKSKEINTLIELICRSKGNINNINNILNG